MAPIGDRKSIGVYSKTLIRSPVVRWILHARIRHQRLNDVVFVGDNFIQVKQVVAEGRLQDIATKHDFDTQIRAAAVFSNEEDDFLAKVKTEHSATCLDDGAIPPQSLVLTLDSNDMVFLFLRRDLAGVVRFVHQSIPIMAFDQILFQPGEHIAVDHQSRALAVAANEKEVVVFTAKPQTLIKKELQQRESNWLPIASQRQFKITGVIQHMDFLVPSEDDRDHVILLLIVIDQRRTKAVWYDWYFSSEPQDVQVHPGQSLATVLSVPSLLVPLIDAAFLLVTGNEMTIWKDILSGSITDQVLIPTTEPPMYPGISSQSPVWASWTRAPRTKTARRDKDFLYMVREDGRVYLFTISSPLGIQISCAGDFQCHVGSAFASLGDEGDPELLAVAGETSGGKVVRMGLWPSDRHIPELSRDQSMKMYEVEFLPNWASVTDMVAAKSVQTSRGLNKDDHTALVTSGRQPYGTVTELRKGVAARIAAIIPISGLRTVTDVWMIPDLLGSIALVMSSPSSTRVMRIEHDASDCEDCDDTAAFDTTRRSLTVGIANGQLIQVTSAGICVTSTLNRNFEDTVEESFGQGVTAMAATIIPEMSIVLTVERREDEHRIIRRRIPSPDSDSVIEQELLAAFPGSPTCLAATGVADGVLVVVCDTTGSVTATLFRDGESPPVRHVVSLPPSMDQSVVCDHMAILRALGDGEDADQLLLVCGLRDGKILSFAIDQHSNTLLVDKNVIDLGYSTVKLTQLPAHPATACAMTGISTYLLSWDGTSAPLLIENIWMADMSNPNFAQTSIVTCAQFPPSVYLFSDTLADSLMMISGDCALVAILDSTATTVARQTPVSGTPNRIIYAETLRCIVCASVRAEVRSFPSPMPHTPPEERRQLWPTLDFIPSKGAMKTFTHDMQPGERVYALLELSITRASGKKHTWILVGGDYVRSNRSRRGRVTFIQPVSQNWEVTGITERKHSTNFDGTVYSMALYDPTTYVACSGEHVYLYRLHVSEMKWDQLCLPFKLSSRGVQVTVETDHSAQKAIVVSTQSDSLITLRLKETSGGFSLSPMSMAPRAHNSLSHLVLPRTAAPYSTMRIDQFTLLTTRDCHLIGLASPSTAEHSTLHYTSAEIMFDAELPRSLTRLTHSKLAARKGPPPKGVGYRVTGCAADGTVYGILLIEEKLWRRLFWLQRLIEWSDELSPHSWLEPAYSTDNPECIYQSQREVPVGLNGGFVTRLLYTSSTRENDMHIDADLLKRSLGQNGVAAIKKVLESYANEDDALGIWLKTHMADEVAAIEDLLATVRVLDEWA